MGQASGSASEKRERKHKIQPIPNTIQGMLRVALERDLVCIGQDDATTLWMVAWHIPEIMTQSSVCLLGWVVTERKQLQRAPWAARLAVVTVHL